MTDGHGRDGAHTQSCVLVQCPCLVPFRSAEKDMVGGCRGICRFFIIHPIPAWLAGWQPVLMGKGPSSRLYSPDSNKQVSADRFRNECQVRMGCMAWHRFSCSLGACSPSHHCEHMQLLPYKKGVSCCLRPLEPFAWWKRILALLCDW